MLKRCWIGVLVVLAGIALPAQGQVKMEWKFKDGDKFYLENTTVQKQTIEVLGQKIDQETENTTVTSFTVLKKGEDSTVIEQKIESMKAMSKGGLGGDAMDKVAKQMKGATFKFTLDNKGQITKFEGLDEFIKKIAGDDAAMAQIMKLVLNEDTVKQSASEAFGFLPDKAVSRGDKWKKEMTIPLGPLGSFKAEHEYTYVGQAKDGEEIGMTAKMTYTAPKDNAGGDVLPFKVTKGDFKTEEAKGTIVFDPTTGRLVREEMKLKLKGSMTIEAMGQIDMKMEQDTTTKIRLLDKPPKD